MRGNSDIYGIYAVYDSSMFYLFILDICEFYMWIYIYNKKSNIRVEKKKVLCTRKYEQLF